MRRKTCKLQQKGLVTDQRSVHTVSKTGPTSHFQITQKYRLNYSVLVLWLMLSIRLCLHFKFNN